EAVGEPPWAGQQQQQQQQQMPPPDAWEAPLPGEFPQAQAPEATPPESVPIGSSGGAGQSRRTRSARSAFEDEVRDPPRSSYALLESPGAVVAEEEFELKFGLSPTEVAGVAGPALERPAGSIGSYFLTVQIVADGFDIRPGERWRHELPVTADAPYPVQVIHLRAKPQTEAVRSGAIQAIYSVSGQSMGFAVRPVAVVANPSVVATPPDVDAEGATVSVPMDEPAADLTVRIQMGHDPGTLLWTFDTPHRGIAIPDEPVTTSIGDDPQAFARKLVDQMGLKEGQPGVYLSLGGI